MAPLNHPKICALDDVGPSCLVVAYLESESPREPISTPLTVVSNWQAALRK